MRMLNLSDLRGRGIPFSRQHIHRLVAAGKFPRPAKIGENTNAWPEPEIEQYLKRCIAARDAGAGKPVESLEPSQPPDSVKAAPAVQPRPQRRRRGSRPAADAGTSAT
jgi:prophage regulatory protein